jgi:hypothetical protein
MFSDKAIGPPFAARGRAYATLVVSTPRTSLRTDESTHKLAARMVPV